MKFSPPAAWTRHTRLAVLIGALLWLAIAAVVGVGLQREHRQVLEQAGRDAGTLATVLEENTARHLGGVALAVNTLAGYFSDGAHARHDAAARELMRSQLPFLPGVRAIFVIGVDGRILHDTDFPGTPDVSLADRDYFRAYVRDPGLKAALSSPLRSRSGTGWFVASTHRITGPDGSFRGVVVAAVQLDSLSLLYRKLGLGAGQHLKLFDTAGHVLGAYPLDGLEIGSSYAQVPLFTQHLRTARSGVYESDAPPFGVRRIVGYRQLDALPLVVAISTEVEAVLAPWRRTAGAAGAGMLLVAALIAAGVTFFVQRQDHHLRAQRHRAAEAQLRTLADQLAHTDRVKTEFLATLSHELRNVLAPMHNGMHVLEMAPAGSAPAGRALAIVKRQVTQMRTLVDDLLDVSRVSSGKVHLHKEVLDLRPLLAAAAESAQPAYMEASGHRLETAWPDEPLPVEADRNRLLQVLANLLGNAGKYTPKGGVVSLRARRRGDEAVIEVADTGIGIPEAAQAKVFEMFEQVDGHGDHAQGGLGIGLALVQRLVHLHDGHVEVFSAGDGKGSTFTVCLPLTRTAVPGAATVPAPSSQTNEPQRP